MGYRIEKVFAFIMVDPADGDEGLPAMTLPDGMMVPMVGSDMDRIADFRPFAQRIATKEGVAISLCVFETRKEIEVILPLPQGNA